MRVQGSSMGNRKLLAAGLLAAGMAAAALAQASEPVNHVTGDGEKDRGQELFALRCNACHEVATITVRRASADEWYEIIDRMMIYGAQVTEAEVEAIVSYLAKNYGPDAASSSFSR